MAKWLIGSRCRRDGQCQWGRSKDGCIKWGRRKGAVFGVNLGRAILTNGTLLRSCVEVCEPMELTFGVVSGVTEALMH